MYAYVLCAYIVSFRCLPQKFPVHLEKFSPQWIFLLNPSINTVLGVLSNEKYETKNVLFHSILIRLRNFLHHFFNQQQMFKTIYK